MVRDDATIRGNRIGIVLVVTVILSGHTVWGAPQIAPAKIRSIDEVGQTITAVVSDEGFPRDLKLTDDARVEVDRKPAQISDLKPGMSATIIVDLRAETVSSIRATSESPAKEPKPKKADGEETDEDSEESEEAEAEGEDDEPKRRKSSQPEIAANGDCPSELAEIDEIVRDYLEGLRVRGAAMVIVKDGKCIMKRGYGFADEAKTTPSDPDILYPIDDVSKVFTSAAILKLSEDGKVDLDGKLFDKFSLPEEAKKLAVNSKFFDMTPMHLLKNHGGFENDPFSQQLLNNPLFKGQAETALKTLPDPEGFVYKQEVKTPFIDFGYMLLGRMIAKVGGGLYEPNVKRMVLDPAGATKARVEIVGKVVLEENDKAKKRRRAGNTGPDAPVFGGIAEVVDTSGKEPAEPSMMIDSAGGWVCSAMDLARFAMALDDNNPKAILKRDSLVTLLTKPGAGKAEGADTKKKPSKNPPKSSSGKSKRVVTTDHFASGWTVQVPKGESNLDYPKMRRYSKSGMASLTSENHLHIVIVMTSMLKESKSGEHPLMLKLKPHLADIEEWPDVDYFKAAPSSDPNAPMPPPAVASTDKMPAPATASPTPMEPGSTLPELPTPGTGPSGNALAVEGLIQGTVGLKIAFMIEAGNTLAESIRTSGSLIDFYGIGQQHPEIATANDKALNGLVALSQAALVLPSQMKNMEADPKEIAAAEAARDYVEASARVANNLKQLLATKRSVEEQKEPIAQHRLLEEQMGRKFSLAVLTLQRTYPLPVKAAESPEEFHRQYARFSAVLGAGSEERNQAVQSRTPRINAIRAKGAGAPPNEIALLPVLEQEIRDRAAVIVEEQKEIRAAVVLFEAEESKANSKYAPVWKATLEFADAQIAFSEYLSKMGQPDFNAAAGPKLAEEIKRTEALVQEKLIGAHDNAPKEVAKEADGEADKAEPKGD